MAEKKRLREKIREYFRNVVAELKRVSWPSRKEIINSTATVLIFVLFWAVFIGLWDYLFAFLMDAFLTKPIP